MSTLTLPSLYAVERRWSDAQDDLRHARRQLASADASALPTPVQAVGGIFLTTWAGYAGESARLAAGFVLALSAADYTFHDTDGHVADRLLHVDGRLGWRR